MKVSIYRIVLNPNQIRTILECYKESVFTQLFPERAEQNKQNSTSHDINADTSQDSIQNFIPKTLIFAKDDNHAEEIVRIAREVFHADNDFCQKITYNISKQSPEELISAFRNDAIFRIAVTVDMIATGTDIKPLEVLIFMRDVKSKLYYEQMLGRGVRTIPSDDLKALTPNASAKRHFFVIDAVGVTGSLKTISAPLERKKGVSFKKLLDNVAMGANDEDTISSLASRLAKLAINATPQESENIRSYSGGKDLQELANALLLIIDSNFEGVANSRFELFKGWQIKRGIELSPAQLNFLTHIKDYIITNAYLAHDDLQWLNDAYGDTNGIFVAKALFKERFATLLDELNLALISGINAMRAS